MLRNFLTFNVILILKLSDKTESILNKICKTGCLLVCSEIYFFIYFRKKDINLNSNELRKLYDNLEKINSILSINELKIV